MDLLIKSPVIMQGPEKINTEYERYSKPFQVYSLMLLDP